MRRLAHDVERDLAFYRTAVGFRNAVERMMLARGTLLDSEHVFWGFGPRQPHPERGSDDDGLAGSPVPLRPRPSAGGAAAAIERDSPEQLAVQ
jgi:hypothetical protein